MKTYVKLTDTILTSVKVLKTMKLKKEKKNSRDNPKNGQQLLALKLLQGAQF